MLISLSSGAKLEAWDFNKVIMIIMSSISIWNYSRTIKNFQGMCRPCSNILLWASSSIWASEARRASLLRICFSQYGEVAHRLVVRTHSVHLHWGVTTHNIEWKQTSASSSPTLLFKLSFCTLNDSFKLEISFTLLSRLCRYCWVTILMNL